MIKNPETIKQIGNEAFKKSDFPTAIAHYKRAKQLDPSNIIYSLNIAAVHLKMENYMECINECDVAIQNGRASNAESKLIAKAFCRMGMAYRDFGDLESAQVAFSQALEEEDTMEYRKFLSDVETAISANDWSSATGEGGGDGGTTAAKSSIISAEEVKKAGNEAFRNSDFQIALANYQLAKQLDPKNMIYSLNIGATHLKMNNYYDCINECNSAIQVGRDNGAEPKLISKAMSRMGFAYRDLGQLENAKMFFSRALTEYPTPEHQKYLSEIEGKIQKEKPNNIALPSTNTAGDNTEGLDLPPGWAIDHDANGRIYYLNHATKLTQWEHPLKMVVQQEKQQMGQRILEPQRQQQQQMEQQRQQELKQQQQQQRQQEYEQRQQELEQQKQQQRQQEYEQQRLLQEQMEQQEYEQQSLLEEQIEQQGFSSDDENIIVAAEVDQR